MKTSVLTLFLGLCLYSQAAIDPYYKEAIERGYKIKDDSVVFPDKTMCLYKSFLDGTCGQKWKTNDYCVPEGKPVWDTTKCCEGLHGYIMPTNDGQATCEKFAGQGLKNKLAWLWFVFPAVFVFIALFALRINYKNRRAKKA